MQDSFVVIFSMSGALEQNTQGLQGLPVLCVRNKLVPGCRVSTSLTSFSGQNSRNELRASALAGDFPTGVSSFCPLYR